MSTEVIILSSTELLEVAKKSSINITKAKAYAMGYAPFMEQVNELSSVLAELNIDEPTSEDAMKARRARLDLVKVRKMAEEKKSKDKETIVIEGRLIDGLFNVVKSAAQLTEAEYLEIEKHQELAEAARKESLKAERSLLLEPYGTDLTFIAVGEMTNDQFNAFLDVQKAGFEAKIEAARVAEIARIEAEKKAETDRIEKEKAEKAERERIEAENARLKAEQEKLKKEQEAERKKQADIQAKKDAAAKSEIDRLAAIAKSEKEAAEKEAAKLKAENDKIAAAAKVEADKQAAEIARVKAELKAKEEADALAHEQEKQRIEAEEAERIANAKAKALAPDKEKINAMYLSIKNFQFPELSDPVAIQLVNEVKEGFSIILKGIIEGAKQLK